MTSISVFGTGNMGNAIGGLLAQGGADVSYITKDQGAESLGDIVVLAVPYSAIAGIVSTYGGELAGKTVVDITNPLDFATFDDLVVPTGSSAAAELQAQFPQAHVVKAFNTNFASTLASKKIGDLPTTVLVAGDDARAKSELIAAVEAGGATAIDAGSLKRAHELEAVGFLQLTLAASEKVSWTGGFAVVR